MVIKNTEKAVKYYKMDEKKEENAVKGIFILKGRNIYLDLEYSHR